MRHCLLPATGLIACALIGSSPASATFAAGAYSITLNEGLNTANGYNTFSGFGTHSDIADNGSRIDVTIGQTGGGFIEYTGSGNTESEGSASMSFTVRVEGNGPLNPFGMVEMRLTSKGETSTTGFYQANAGISMDLVPLHPFDFYLPIAFSFNATSCSGSLANCPSGLSGPGGWDVTDFVFYMLPYRDYTVTLGTGLRQSQPDRFQIQQGFGTPQSGTGRAYVDPVISLAPSSTGFTFYSDFPEPVGGTVPEPASWAMLIAGFGMIGSALRRQRLTGRAAG